MTVEDIGFLGLAVYLALCLVLFLLTEYEASRDA
jgi:hypothetical protein